MDVLVAILFVIAAIGLFFFFFLFPASLGWLSDVLRWRRARAHAALCGQVGTATSDFTRTLAGTVSTGEVAVAGAVWNAKCHWRSNGDISHGDSVVIISVEGRILWVRKIATLKPAGATI